MAEHKRFIISIPYYAEDVSEVREAVKKLEKKYSDIKMITRLVNYD